MGRVYCASVETWVSWQPSSPNPGNQQGHASGASDSSGEIWGSAHVLEVKGSVLSVDVSPVPGLHQLDPTDSTPTSLVI